MATSAADALAGLPGAADGGVLGDGAALKGEKGAFGGELGWSSTGVLGVGAALNGEKGDLGGEFDCGGDMSASLAEPALVFLGDLLDVTG
jgi:hypothetical protein